MLPISLQREEPARLRAWAGFQCPVVAPANDRDIRLLLTADYAFLPRRLANHYEVPPPENEDPWAAFAAGRS